MAELKKKNESVVGEQPKEEIEGGIESDEDISADASLQKAIDDYRKIIENNAELTEKQMDDLDKICNAIREREIIDLSLIHI